ncbi:MAG: exodeoxyribonuclease VII large subunit [Clostridia bacterium]
MEDKQVLSVSQLNKYIKFLFDNEPLLRNVYVKGEISNYTYNTSSRHMYFTLKDKESAIKVVAFRDCTSHLAFEPSNGLNIICVGNVSVFEKAGQYQIIATHLEPEGVGSLALEFERLKKKLASEGLFSLDIKKKIPKIPTSIGVITSPTGAAVRDIINVTARRHPLAHIYLKPVLVQGDKAAEQVAAAIEYFNTEKTVDVLIVGRGGGSTEDLWAFNSERIAYAIYNSKIPVISAVGHEVDFTISDFVADIRAATPSVAAEVATPDKLQLIQKFKNLKVRLTSLIEKELAFKKQQLATLKASEMLKSPKRYIDDKKQIVDYDIERLKSAFKDILTIKKQLLAVQKTTLKAINPTAVLTRGYSIITDNKGKVVSKVEQMKKDDDVKVKLSNGTADCKVNAINKNKGA